MLADMDTTISPTPAWRTLLEPLITTRGYRALTHHLLGLPLGVLYFSWLVTGLATGLGLAITVIGIPLLTLVFATVRPLLAGERTLANSLLDAEIASAPLSPASEGGWLQRLAAYWRDSATWRGIVYLIARFPIGLATFIVAVTAYAAALILIAAPLLASIDPIELGFWEPDSALEGLALVPFGLIALIAAAWICEGMAVVSRALARWGAR
jgi:hypothetical protein